MEVEAKKTLIWVMVLAAVMAMVTLRSLTLTILAMGWVMEVVSMVL